jgi:hypothetical protein
LAKARVIVVFDGAAGAAHPAPSSRSGLDVVFSAPPQNADQRIVSILKSRRDNGSMTVVTADLDLQWEVKKLGAHVVDPGDFLSQFAPREPPKLEMIEKPITTREEVEWGIETFGDGIIKTETAVRTPSPISPKGRTASAEEKKERNRRRYLRQIARKY